jgi:hypothetical protein
MYDPKIVFKLANSFQYVFLKIQNFDISLKKFQIFQITKMSLNT